MRENSIASVLVGLKDTSQVVAHCDIFSKSMLSWPEAVKGLSTTLKRLVSSANKRIFEPISETICNLIGRVRSVLVRLAGFFFHTYQ